MQSSFVDFVGGSVTGRLSLEWSPGWVGSFGFAVQSERGAFVDVGWFLADGPRGYDPWIVFDDEECSALLMLLQPDDVVFRSILACVTRFEPDRDANGLASMIDPHRLAGPVATEIGEWIVAHNRGRWTLDGRGRKTLESDLELGVGITWRGQGDSGFPWEHFEPFLEAIQAS